LPNTIKRVAVQCDYHYVRAADPCLRASDMVFFRASEHPALAYREHGLVEPQLRWLPFSVDTQWVPRDMPKNYSKVFFSGNSLATA
jgi:hypothetical protein